MGNKKTDDYREMYVTAAGVIITPHDCRIIIGDPTGDPESPVLEKALIILPLVIGKGMTQQLIGGITSHEQEFGMITGPQRQQPQAVETPAEAQVRAAVVNRKSRRAAQKNQKGGTKPNGLDGNNKEGQGSAAAAAGPSKKPNGKA